jgi:hypothetical protein
MSKQQLTAIAMRWLPKGYKVEYRKSLSGTHYGDRALIQAPRPTTPKSLYVWLHECAHAYLHTGSGKYGKVYIKELEAELWARVRMGEAGVPVPPEMIESGKRYIAYKIVKAERRGGKNFDPRAIEFAGAQYLAAQRARRNRPMPASVRRRFESERAFFRELRRRSEQAFLEAEDAAVAIADLEGAA